MLHEVTLVPITSLIPSQTPMQIERRKHRTESDIQGIADSIKSIGRVIHAIVARPLGDDGQLEIVAGEGRFLGAQLAGLTHIPVTVWELTDEQAEEVQLVENLQRNDLHELVEAEGYEALLKRGHTADEIAEKVGKSKRTIYTRLQLLKLEPESREVFRRGDLSASTAMLIARIPAAVLQRQACEEIFRAGWDGEPMSYREALRHVRQRYMLALNEAPFDTADEQLVPDAGACGRCPKRTGNQPELFEDVTGADVCTDTKCFELKRQAHAAGLLKNAQASGQRVISGKEAEQVVSYEDDDDVHIRSDKFVRLDDTIYDGKKHRTYKEVLPADTQPILLSTPKGQVIEVIDRKVAEKAKKAAGIGVAATGSTSNAKKQSAEDEKREREVKLKIALFSAIYQKAKPKSLRQVVQTFITRESAYGMDLGTILEALGWDDFDMDRVEAELSKLTDTEFARFVNVLQFEDELRPYGGSPTRMSDAAKSLGINIEKLLEEPTAENKSPPVKKKATKPKKAARKPK